MDETTNTATGIPDGYNGAHIDTRPVEAKLKDYHFGETVAAAAPVNWTEKTKYRSFPIFDQDGSGSCVAQTMAKLMGIMYWLLNGVYVHFSATHVYQRRFNKPDGGMAGVDAFDIARKGVTLEALVPSQKMSDAEMDAVKIEAYKEEVGKVFALSNYLTIPVRDIETVASIIQQTGKGVMVWFYFKSAEWDKDPSVKYPDLDLYAASTARHSVAAVDYTLYKGKKAIVIDDSWGPNAGNGSGQRVIDEDFFKTRNWFAAYPINFKFQEGSPAPTPSPTPTPTPTKPTYNFTKQLKFIPWDTSKNQPADMVAHNAQKPDVTALQDCLKYLGLFPSNIQSTGYFGAITKDAVLAFQKRYNIDMVGEVGPITRAKLNELF